jgi:hypothetical protein
VVVPCGCILHQPTNLCLSVFTTKVKDGDGSINPAGRRSWSPRASSADTGSGSGSGSGSGYTYTAHATRVRHRMGTQRHGGAVRDVLPSPPASDLTVSPVTVPGTARPTTTGRRRTTHRSAINCGGTEGTRTPNRRPCQPLNATPSLRCLSL